MNRKKFVKEQEVQIYNAYFSPEKLSTYDLAKKWNCSVTAIRNVIIKYGLRTNGESHKIFSKEQELQICKQYTEDKLSTLEIAKIWGCSYLTIRNIMRRNEYPLRTHEIFTKEQELQICNDYFSEEKPSTITLAKKCGCSSAAIRDTILRNGYVLRPRGETLKNKIFTEEHRRKIREKTILQHQTHQGPFKDTKPELAMENILVFLNIPYEKQFRIGNHLADFHFLNTNILAEVDGDYWHGNLQIFSSLTERQLKQKEKDKKFEQLAKEKGFVVLRFWESNILKNTEEVIKIIKENF